MWFPVLVIDAGTIESTSVNDPRVAPAPEDFRFRLVIDDKDGKLITPITAQEYERICAAPRWVRRAIVERIMRGHVARWVTGSASVAL